MIGKAYLSVFAVFLVTLPMGVVSENIINDLIKEMGGGICSTIATAGSAKHCGKNFNEEINSIDNQIFEELKYRKFCCAFNHLSDCFMEAVGDSCGDQEGSIINQAIELATQSAKMSTERCDTYSGTTGTILCLNDYLLVGATIVLFLLLVFVCCTTCSKMCRSGNRRKSGHILLLPRNSGDKNRF